MEFFEAFGNIIEKTSPPSTRLRTTAADGWPSPRGATTYMHSDADGPIHGAALDTGMNSVYQSTESSVPSAPSDTKSKPVRFELILPHAPHQRGRLPMRVQILPGDNTSDIIDTIRSFYGIYKPWGVSLEDSDGNTLIASFDNFRHNMVVYVRVTDGVDMDDYATDHKEPFSRRPSQAIDGHHMHHIAHDHGPTSRSYSKLGSTQLNSPQPGRGRRSESVQKSMTRSRGHSSHSKLPGPAEEHEYDSASDGSDRRGKKEQVASAEISVDNIVEGGRRKRAKFDSSELPLYQPPHLPHPASVSSISPQRRASGYNGASPYTSTNQQTYPAIPSPYSHRPNDAFDPRSQSSNAVTTGEQGHWAGNRAGRHYGNTPTVMPTPAHTQASVSVISDEDVARQLMRLGDASNFPSQERVSTSSLDDALSGKAEVSSSSEDSDLETESTEEQELPPLPYSMPQSAAVNGHNYDEWDRAGPPQDDCSPRSRLDDNARDGYVIPGPPSLAKSRAPQLNKLDKAVRARPASKARTKSVSTTKQPLSPTSLPPSRKTSSASLQFQQQLAPDEEDLSSKPRCQRCRKSKKGCDRQRPCGRCKDAGIGIEGCISEDEGNGRKGRFGRVMNIPVKKAQALSPLDQSSGLAGPTEAKPTSGSVVSTNDKSRKRKR